MKNLSKLHEMESVRNEVEKCIGCGCCLFYCPVYSETADEDYVARGRNRLVKGLLEDCQDLVSGAKDRFDKCLLCGRCTMACPQGVRNDLITLAARGELVKRDGLPLSKSVAFRQLMKNREKMKKAVRGAAKFQWMLPVTKREKGSSGVLQLEEYGKTRHVPLVFGGSEGGRQVPSISGSFLSDQVPQINPPEAKVENRGIRVAYFAGCATEFVFPQAGKALIRLLNRSGVEVLFPKNQGCCGTAARASGDIASAREMALHNLGILSELDPDFIVTGCATCGSALKEGWISLATDETTEDRIGESGRQNEGHLRIHCRVGRFQTTSIPLPSPRQHSCDLSRPMSSGSSPGHHGRTPQNSQAGLRGTVRRNGRQWVLRLRRNIQP